MMADIVDITSLLTSLDRALSGPDGEAAYDQCQALITEARRLRRQYREQSQAQCQRERPETKTDGLAAHEARDAKKRIEARINKGAKGLEVLGERAARVVIQLGMNTREQVAAAFACPQFAVQLLRQPNFGRAFLNDLKFWAFYGDDLEAEADALAF